jgi:hypothetical protein
MLDGPYKVGEERVDSFRPFVWADGSCTSAARSTVLPIHTTSDCSFMESIAVAFTRRQMSHNVFCTM